MTLLVIDDEKRVRDIIANQISRIEDIKTYQAGNGKEALEIMKKEGIDAVLADISMPVMDGLEFLRILREEGSQVPAIMMSGYDEFKFAQEAIHLGALDYLLKPIAPDALIKTVKDLKEKIAKRDLKDRNARKPLFNELLNGAIKTSKEAYEKMDVLGIPSTNSLYMVGFLHALTKEGNLILPQTIPLSRVINDNSTKEMTAYSYLYGNDNILILLFHNATEDKALEEARNLIKSVNAKLLKEDGIRLFAALSKPTKQIIALKDAAIEASVVYRAETAFVTDYKFYRKIEGDHLALLKIAEEEIDALIKTLAEGSGDFSEIFNLAFSKMSELAVTGADDWNYPLLYMARKAETLLKSLPDEVRSDIIILLNALSSSRSLIQAKGIMKDASNKISSAFKKFQEPKMKAVIKEIKETISKNIANERFSVSDALKGISYSENYIRYIFSNAEGMSLKEYMIKARMEEAFRLLREGKSVKDVAFLTGYSNQRYFARFFKDYTGLTPTEWKEKDQK